MQNFGAVGGDGGRVGDEARTSSDSPRPAPPTLPLSCSLPPPAPNFFPRKALRKRPWSGSLAPRPPSQEQFGLHPPLGTWHPALSLWHPASHVALWSSLACVLRDPDLTPLLPSPPGASPSGHHTYFKGQVQGTGCKPRPPASRRDPESVFPPVTWGPHPTTVSTLFTAYSCFPLSPRLQPPRPTHPCISLLSPFEGLIPFWALGAGGTV